MSLWKTVREYGSGGESPEPKKNGNSEDPRSSYFTVLPKMMTDRVMYEIQPAPENPNVEIVFLHGFKVGDSSDAYWKDWLSGDGSHCWLESWLGGEFPEARILTVCYDSSLTHTPTKRQADLESVAQSLMYPLIRFKARVGQSNCPVILVGHSLGGLVMKKLMVMVHSRVFNAKSNPKEVADLESFLNKVRGLFFYATPHTGSRLAQNMRTSTSSPLLESLQIFGAQTGRLHAEFIKLSLKYNWRLFGLGEKFETKLGPNFSGLVVEQASAEHSMETTFTMVEADHFTICKPENKSSLSFQMLTFFIDDIKDSLSGQICGDLPQYLVPRQKLPDYVEKTLTDGGALGIFGMGGIGKTTFAKQLFNEISSKFEYTCFVNDVKGIQSNELDRRIRENLHHVGRGSGSRTLDWADLRGRKTLIVMDDVSCEEQLNVLPGLEKFGTGSLKIFTSRHISWCPGKNIVFFEKDFLEPEEARKLFCHHAFDSENIPEELQKVTSITKHVEGIVSKCDRLPLSLEVIGKHVYFCRKWGDHPDAEMWDGILESLSRAQAVDGERSDKLFANLQVSYDALAEDEQEMFRDIATFFSEKRLDETLAAIGTSKGNSNRAVKCWRNLVRRSLVKERIQERRLHLHADIPVPYQEVWMHEQLRDLGKRLAGASGRTTEEIIDKINSDEVQVHHLRSVESNEKDLKLSSLAKLTKLKYLTLYRCNLQGASQDFPRELVLLQWESDRVDVMHDFLGSQLHFMRTLAVLELTVTYHPESAILIEGLGTLVNLMILKLKVNCELGTPSLKLPQNFGGLAKLQSLTLSHANWILPESFGQLSSLVSLTFDEVGTTQLPDSFGSLCRLKTLFVRCYKLTHFPESFGKLCKLEKLVIIECLELEVLPKTLGDNPTSLRVLVIAMCPKLKQLPHSFSNLLGLRTLICRLTPLDIVGAFQDFSMHEHMEILELELWNGNLPESFSHLSSKTLRRFRLTLREVRMSDNDTRLWDFPSLEGLITQAKELTLLFKSLGERLLGDCIELRCELEEGPTSSNQQILAMKGLEIQRRPWTGSRPELQSLPDCIGNLTSLQELNIFGDALLKLPESIGNLGALKDLSIRCLMLETLPESMGQLGSLTQLTIEDCATLKFLPESMQQLGSLEELRILDCTKLVTLPEGMGNLISLKAVILLRCRSLKAVPRNWGRVASVKTSSPKQASTSSSSSRTGFILTVDLCPSLDDFVKSLNWDNIELHPQLPYPGRDEPWFICKYVRETRLS